MANQNNNQSNEYNPSGVQFASTDANEQPLGNSTIDRIVSKKQAKAKQNKSSTGMGTKEDLDKYNRYESAYKETAIVGNDTNLRDKLYESGVTDSYAQDEFVGSIVNKAENLARSKKLSVVDDDTFDQVIKETGLDGYDRDIVDNLKIRAQSRYNNAVGLYKLRLKNDLIQKPSDPKPQPEESCI
jgi:Ni,Fe-hydrogenase I large subunit